MNSLIAQQDEAELIKVLQNSLYPGASVPSVKMVLGYCQASGLDPMQKPVHIVPIWDAKAGAMRDVVMPGIGLYRTQAARTGQYAGVTDPEYGPDANEKIGGVEMTYPTWCRVTVKRLLDNGQIAEFSATERWKENYAIKGGKEKSVAPNAMWQRRPYAQLAKCAEAQALRKAFPEFGSQATADEMEGKEIDMGPAEIVKPQASQELINQAEAAANSGRDAFASYWKKISKDDRGLLVDHLDRLKQLTEEAEETAVPPAIDGDFVAAYDNEGQQ